MTQATQATARRRYQRLCWVEKTRVWKRCSQAPFASGGLCSYQHVFLGDNLLLLLRLKAWQYGECNPFKRSNSRLKFSALVSNRTGVAVSVIKMLINLDRGWLAIVLLLAIQSTNCASLTPLEAQNALAKLQQLRARAQASSLVTPPNVASFFVSITNTLISPAYIENDFNDAALIFRQQASSRDPKCCLITALRWCKPTCQAPRRS